MSPPTAHGTLAAELSHLPVLPWRPTYPVNEIVSNRLGTVAGTKYIVQLFGRVLTLIAPRAAHVTWIKEFAFKTVARVAMT